MKLPWPAYLIAFLLLLVGTWFTSVLIFSTLISLAIVGLTLSSPRRRSHFRTLGLAPVFALLALGVTSIATFAGAFLISDHETHLLGFAAAILIGTIGLGAATAFTKSSDPDFPLWAGLTGLVCLHPAVIYVEGFVIDRAADASSFTELTSVVILALSALLVAATMAHLATSRFCQRDYLATAAATAACFVYVAPAIANGASFFALYILCPLILLPYCLFRLGRFLVTQTTLTPLRRRITASIVLGLLACFLGFKATGGSTKDLLLSIPPVESAASYVDDLFVERPPPSDVPHCRVGMDY